MTIQERAEQYANRKTGYSHDSRWREAFKDFCQGAESQKAIDDEEYRKDMRYVNIKKQELIEKACLAYCDVCYNRQTGCEELCSDLKVFRKAMEE